MCEKSEYQVWLANLDDALFNQVGVSVYDLRSLDSLRNMFESHFSVEEALYSISIELHEEGVY